MANSAGNNIQPPIPPAVFEQILQDCAEIADFVINGTEFDPMTRSPSEGWATYCANGNNRRELGRLKHEAAEDCVAQSMADLGKSDEASVEQSYELGENGSVSTCARGTAGSIRPDVVLHAPGDPLSVLGVYDFKFPCGGGRAHWTNSAPAGINAGLSKQILYQALLDFQRAATLIAP